MNQEKKFVATVLQVLSERQITASKILIQKFIYFLGIQGINTGFSFCPYTYGPFSFDLASVLGSMNFWNEIKEDYSEIKIININNYCIESGMKNEVAQKLTLFEDIVGTFDFKNLELVGTLLYCTQVLKKYGDKVDEKSVTDEFKEWKHNKYSDFEIHETYKKIIEYL